MGAIFRYHLARNLIIKLHSPEKGFYPALLTETYTTQSCGTCITVALKVVLIGDKILYMSGTGGKGYSHYGKIKYLFSDLDNFT